jgi:NAD(P)H-hydrate repair Nnr-like enzyme with NAD(P)H-hydrate dehydratase domain
VKAARFLRLASQDVQNDRVASIAKLVDQTQAIVVLKGQHTLVASPMHAAHTCQEGNAGMAVGGMGDVLTGRIAALAAQGIKHQLNLWDATCLGVHLHALAGDTFSQKRCRPDWLNAK